MYKVIVDPQELKRLIRQRRRTGRDRYDEVWDGVYVMSPLADNEHQKIAYRMARAVEQGIGDERAQVFVGVNVSDRSEAWRKNYRCPDVAVFLPGNPAQDRGTHWFGGPDFAVEVISPHDKSRCKLPFYARVGTREVLLLDRDPWSLELYRARDGAMVLVGASTPEAPAVLASAALPLAFRLAAGAPRPTVEVVRADGDRRWTV